jgi:hypothetical protein
MRLSIKIPRGYEEKFNKLPKEQRDGLKDTMSKKIGEELDAIYNAK